MKFINFIFVKQHNYYVYITTNPSKKVFYVGVTNDLAQRIIEHYLNRGQPKTFAGRYYAYCLIYYEQYNYIDKAIAREKELKGWSRIKKLDLIISENPNLNFLNGSLVDFWPPKDASHRSG